MAVFVAASDETSGPDHRSQFFHCGLLAPETDWSNVFTSLWEKRVLKGPPTIEYLHMTEIRSEEWRNEQGIDRGEAEFRIDEAFGVIDAISTLVPISCSVNSGHLLDTFQKKFKSPTTGGARRFEPDYLAFIGYAYTVLAFAKAKRPNAKGIDFLVEHKKKITTHLQEFYNEMPIMLNEFGRSDLVELLGKLRSGDKKCIALQAADVLCWYKRRAENGALDEREQKRYSKVARKNGVHHEWSKQEVETIYAGCIRILNEQGRSSIG